MFSNFSSFVCCGKKSDLPGYHAHRPGALSEEVKLRIFNALYPVAIEAFRQHPNREFESDVFQHIFSYEHLAVVTEDSGFPIAFRMWHVLEHDDHLILYLAGMCVKPTHQGIGIGEGLLRYVMGLFPNNNGSGSLRYVVMRTQNPVMKKCFDRAMGGISYPNGENIPRDVREASLVVANYLEDGRYDQQSLISRGVYSKSLYGTPPIAVNEPEYGLAFQSVDIDRGDAVMSVWRCF
jgi:GNAT superfamily N-acetyltransferase